jgi:quercetin 2,3-dioxygenase
MDSVRNIKKIHEAAYSPIADLITYSALPSRTVQQIDPFLFLNHHGYQEYPPNNSGLPFGPHPHRGMETVTFILEGDIMHKDSAGHESVIEAGGVQWMTAGRGLIHAEVSSSRFKKEGGKLEILQLWLNLPARFKMSDPAYVGLQKKDIPKVLADDGKVGVNVLSGSWLGKSGPLKSVTEVGLATIEFEQDGKWSENFPAEENIFFYVVRGRLEVNGSMVTMRQLVEFENASEKIEIRAIEKSFLMLGHAKPLNEPVVAQGPFVMNTREEIAQAYQDYQAGKFGLWN